MHIRIQLKIIFLSYIIFLTNCYSQSVGPVNHAFHNSFVIGIDGGITLPQTDYQINKIGYSYRGTFEYFFKTNSMHLFGLKLKLGSEQIKGEDTRGIITTNDGTREIPPSFSSDIYSVGIAATYAVSIGDVFFPYLSAGLSNLWYFPMDDQGNNAVGGNDNLYEKTTIAYSFEGGFKYLLIDNLSVNLSINQFIPQTDYLDDIAAALSNDAYFNILIGFSYSPFMNTDQDNDGVEGADDLCPEEAEDYDGYEDEDGCPEVDNDGDGIVDINDKCPNEAEDKDGYEDEDGCPDVDNDGDGIVDINDKCPDEAEDIDGIEDEDGCPEYEAEVIGEKYILMGDDIFGANSAMIKVEGK